jgi:ATP-dependent DNA helicase RecG
MTNAIPKKESLTCEFKSDRKCLQDKELLEAIICLANTDGGDLYLGVEDDGTATGLHPNHSNLQGVSALIANRTVPPLAVTVVELTVNKQNIARISVPQSAVPVATTDGTTKRRRLDVNGKPECIPFFHHEVSARQASFGNLDMSANPVAGANMADLDPIERARLRQFIKRYNGDHALLKLEDAALDGALGLTVRQGSEIIPSLCGLLLIGHEESLRRLVPTHEIAFQVLKDEEVRLNEFSKAPILRSIEWVETLFKPLNPEKEFQAGLFRVPIPRVDSRAFREALANALTHRDYSKRGAIHIRMETDALVISNPGGLVEGVTLDNLLTTEPRPRNPSLADALKRIGLVERTGRGVDLIYRGMLRYGRPFPDYSRTDNYSVVLRMSMAEADIAFLGLILKEENRRTKPLPLYSLITLSMFREQKRLTGEQLAQGIQQNKNKANQTLEELFEAGLLQRYGTGRGRNYTLSPKVYQAIGKEVEYTRQAGFNKLQQEQFVLNMVKQHGRVQRQDVMALCQLDKDRAYRLLKRLCREGLLVKEGESTSTVYKQKNNAAGKE